MDITITVPDAVAPEVIDALCAVGDYKPSDGPKPAFAKQVLIRYLKRVTANARERVAGQNAAAAANAAAMTDMQGVT